MRKCTKSKWKKSLKLYFKLALLASPIHLLAQDTTNNKILNTALVSGHKQSNENSPKSQIAGNITYIEAKELQNIPALSIDQLLRFAGGVEIQSRNSFGAQADFSIRGSTFTQVLILIDGVRVFDPLTAHSNSFLPVAIQDIERIEIHRGGTSYIFGPDAIGGAINIVTKTASSKFEYDNKKIDLQLGGGQFGTMLGSASYQKEFEKYGISASGFSHSSMGNTMQSGLKNYFDIKTLSILGKIKISEFEKLILHSGLNFSNYNAQNYYTLSSLDSARASNNTIMNRISYIRQKKGNYSNIDLSWQNSQSDFLFNARTPLNVHNSNFLLLQASHNHKLNKNLVLLTGFQSTFKQIVSTDRGDRQRLHAGGYLAAQKNSEKLNLLLEPSIRIDYDESGGVFYSPNLSIFKLWKTTNLGLKGGISNRVADFTELYVSRNLPATISANRNYGNPDLLPEKAFYAEITYAKKYANVKLNGSLFFRNTANMIDYSLIEGSLIPNNGNINPAFKYNFPTNISNVNYYGKEVFLTTNHSLNSNFRIYNNVSYTYVVSDLQSGIYTKYISAHAKHQIQIYSTLQFKQSFIFSFGALYKSRAPYESITAIRPSTNILLLNANLSYWVVPKKIGLKINIENILDNKYFDVQGAQMAPRWSHFVLMIKL
jgi:vitamin B12 transporter